MREGGAFGALADTTAVPMPAHGGIEARNEAAHDALQCMEALVPGNGGAILFLASDYASYVTGALSVPVRRHRPCSISIHRPGQPAR